jgi:small subunit ribosomal protein S20
MPIKHASEKSLRRSIKQAAKNLKIKKLLHQLKKQFTKATTAKDKPKALELFQKFQKAVDKAVKTGLVKKNTAARTKSRLMAFLKKQIS